MEWDGQKAPTAHHAPLGVPHWNEKGNVIADCSENQFTSYDVCDEHHERQQALLASVDDISLGKVSPCDIHKPANSLKLRKAYGLDGIKKECLRYFPRKQLVHDTFI
jgi:hypothetical protein